MRKGVPGQTLLVDRLCNKKSQLDMPRTLPPLNALRAFDAAGRFGSFSRAAEDLNVTHAAVSRHVRGLEKRLGVQLFRIVPRGVELTEAGKRYLAAVAPAFDRIADATEDITDKVEGNLVLSVEPTFALKWLMPRLGGFYDRYPDINLRIEPTGRVVDISGYEADIAIRYSRRSWPELQTDLICSSSMCPVAAPSLVSETPSPMAPEEILKYRLLQEDQGEAWRLWFESAGLENVNVSSVSGSLTAVLAIEGALAGQGIALLSQELGFEELRQGKLRYLSDVCLAYGHYFLVYRHESKRSKAVRAFRDWVLEESRELRDIS